MHQHQNARLTVQSRGEMIRRILAGATLREVAEGFGIRTRTAPSGFTDIVNRALRVFRIAVPRPHRFRR